MNWMSARIAIFLLVPPVFLSAERLAVRVYTTADSLSGNTARALMASPRGHLWVSSGSELVRFDGHTFRMFTTADGWTGGRPLSMTTTRKGEYFIGAAGGVFGFFPEAERDGRFTRIRLPGPAREVRHIFEDSQGRLWVGCDEGGYRRDTSGAWQALKEIRLVKSHDGRRVERFTEDHLGDVWMASFSGIYCYRRNGSVERYSDEDHARLNNSGMAIVEAPDGRIYAGTENGLFRFARPKPDRRAVVDRVWTQEDGLPSMFVGALAVWKGDLWAGTFRGLARIDGQGRLETHTELAGAKEPPVEALMVDHAGTLWLGTDGSGLMAAANRGFTNFDVRDGLAFPRMEQVLEDRNGELIAVSKSEQMLVLNRFDGIGSFESVRPRFPAAVGFSWSWARIALHARTGEWWFASNHGPVTFRAPSFGALAGAAPTLSSDPLAKVRGYVFRMFEDSRGGIWMSIGGRIPYLLYLDPITRHWRRFSERDGYLTGFDNCPASFAEDAAGNIWVGNLEHGLYRYRGGKWEPVTGAEETDKGPRSLHVDQRGRLWAGTKDRGVLRIEDPTAQKPSFQRYNIGNGLSSDNVFCITSDRNGDIYVCTGRGIDRIRPSTGSIRTYTTADGLISGTLRDAYRDHRGALWFATTEGVSRFIPGGESVSEGPRVVIQGIRVADRSIPVSAIGAIESGNVRIEPDQRRLRVDYVAFDAKARYQHRLLGVNDWTAPSGERTVVFEGLASGEYRFQVRAVSEDGTVSREPASVSFRVVPPIWLRWWFLLLAAAAACAGIFALHQYRLKQLLAMERMRLRIASDLHDDIGSGLSQVSMLGELARRSLNSGNPGAAELIDRMAGASREAVSAMGDIVWSIHPRNDRLHGLAQRMRSFASDVLSAGDIHFDFETPDTESEPAISLEARRDLLLIFKESVTNAARHSGCGRVRASLRQEGREVRLIVEDDGKGFDTGRESNGHGLGTIRARAEKLGGRCEIRSGSGAGTRIAVSIPADERHL